MTKQFSNYSDLLTFTRASGGHALRPVSYGAELVTNGDFSDGSTGWTVANTDATHTVTFSNGGARFQSDTTSPILELVSDVVLDSTKIYKLEVVISDVTSGSIKIDGQGVVQSYNSEGTHTSIITTTSTSGNSVIKFYRSTANVDITIDSVSVKEVTFDQPDGTLTLFEHPNNIPRVEWDAQRNRLGLLVEESRTNLFPYSEDFSNAAWEKNAGTTVTTNYATSPDGTQNASRYLGTGTSGFSDKLTLSAGNYVISFWVKSNTEQNQFCRIIGESSNISSDLLVTNEWQRIDYTFTATGGTNKANGIFRDSSDNDIDILVWGAQLEAGSFPTSYIKSNSGSTTTRSADVASIPVADFGFNADAGSLLVSYDTKGSNGTSYPRPAEINDGTSSNRIAFWINPSNNVGLSVSDGGVNQGTVYNGGTLSTDTAIKSAASYKLNDLAHSTNGTTAGTDTSATIPTVTTLRIGSQTSAQELNGHIKSIKYYPRRLTNAQLEDLSS